jgi:DDE superfamily endonuclease
MMIPFNQAVQERFVMEVNDFIVQNNIRSDCAANMDETNCPFTFKVERTYTFKGAKTVAAKGPHVGQRCTLALATTLNGNKLMPFVIFCGVPGGRVSQEPQTHNYPDGMVYSANKTAWMNAAAMHEWIDGVWRPYLNKPERVGHAEGSHGGERCRSH